MTRVKLRQLVNKYPDMWVAMKEKTGEIVGAGKTPKEAYTKSQNKGIKDPLITKIPKNFGTYVLAEI